MKNKLFFTLSLTVSVILLITFIYLADNLIITNFEECIAAGNPAMESYPRQCRDPISDKTFTEDLGLTEVIGEVSLKGELFCPCFEVEGKMVWYNLMEGFNSIDVSEINNGDRVRVQGELQPNGEIYSFSITKEPLIGGQRDEYGCLGPAGFSWNETDQLCVREWTREECPEQKGDVCIEIYEPVCGLPDKQQYSNSCFACLNTPNTHFIEGECQ